MSEIPYVCLYRSYLDTLAPFSEEERGRLVTAMLTYAIKGECPKFVGNERYIWPTIQQQIERDICAYEEKCRRNRENGRKGGRPGKASASLKTEGFSEKPKKPKENKKEKEKEKEKERENEKENAGETGRASAGSGFRPPTVEEVKKFCLTGGLSVNPERFINYYSANGWLVGKNPMQSWQAALKMWEERDHGRENRPHGLHAAAEEDGFWDGKFTDCEV